jgi:hypothetical protein
MEIGSLRAEGGRSPRWPGSKPVALAKDLCAFAPLRLCVDFPDSCSLKPESLFRFFGGF